MNYREESQLKHIESVEFIPLFEEQNPLYPWKGIEENIFQAFYELFSVATSEAPPAGIAHFPQVRISVTRFVLHLNPHTVVSCHVCNRSYARMGIT